MKWRRSPRRKPVHACLKVVFVLIFPIVGLILNEDEAFPADLQVTDVYVLAVINGVLLCIPALKNVEATRMLFGLRCICFPFSAYFFLIFLPVLPVAVLLVLLCGVGLLMLTPTVLFIVHVKILRQGFRDLFSEDGRKQKALACGLFLLLPGWYFMQAHSDRKFVHVDSIREGVRHAFSPDLESASVFYGNHDRTLRSIKRFADFRFSGRYPLLSALYGSYVFDDLTISKNRMHHVQDVYFGERWDSSEAARNKSFRGLPRPILREPVGWSRDRRRSLPRSVSDGKIRMNVSEVHHASEAGLVRTRVVLKLDNEGGNRNEFVATLRVPEGVFVSGYWLHVGEERVPGRIFEANTAISTYHGIRNRRRDPGIVSYQSPTELQLRVFPFSSDPESPFKVRTTEIEFLYPEGWKPRITIAAEVVDLGQAEEIPEIYLAESEAGAMVVVPAQVRRTLPRVLRAPYLHFNLDRSRYAEEAGVETTLDVIRERAWEFPEIRDFTLSLANYDYHELLVEPAPLSDIRRYLAPERLASLPAAGACLESHAVGRVLHRYRKHFLDSGDADKALRVPVVRSVLHYEYPLVNGLKLDELRARVTPDESERERKPVILLRMGRLIRPLVADHEEGQGLAAQFKGAEAGAPLEVYDPDEKQWTALATANFTPDSSYSEAAELLLRGTAAKLNPHERERQWRSIVKQSKRAGVLSCFTAFIVVENDGQWNALEYFEKKKLSPSSELEFMMNPEPPLWLLLPLFLVAGWLHHRKRSVAGSGQASPE